MRRSREQPDLSSVLTMKAFSVASTFVLVVHELEKTCTSVLLLLKDGKKSVHLFFNDFPAGLT
jgi:hypothetical protein